MEVSSASQAASESNSQPAPSTSVASSGGDINFQELFETTQKELQSTKAETQELQQRLKLVGDESQKTGSELKRIRQAITGEDEGAAKKSQTETQIEELQSQLDALLDQAMELDRKGQSIPITTNIGVQSLKFQIDALKQRESDRQEIEKLKAQIKEQSDPSRQAEQMAFSHMDSHLEQVLATIYGPKEDVSAQRQVISATVIKELKDLRQKDPETFGRLVRDQAAQKSLVNHFAERIIPPKAREILKQDEIRRTPLGVGELMDAFREAKEAAAKGDASAKEYVVQIRQQLLERMTSKSLPGMGRGSRFE